MAKKKPRALTRSTRQTGSSDMARDRKRKALAPGKRRSKNGNIYTENRKNRSDVKGRDTPTKVKKRVRTISVAKIRIPFTAERKMRIYKQYKKNEENNYHTENAVMLIKLFGTPTQYKKAMMIKKNRDKRGLTGTESAWLYKYGHSHYNKIKPAAIKRITKTRLKPGKSESYSKAKDKLYRSMGARPVGVEPHRGVRKHALLPLAIRKKLPPLYATDGKKDKMIYLKLFSPYSGYTLYVAEFDGKDTFFGYVTGMGSNEWGYSSYNELASANKRGLPLIERDKWFSPKTISSIKDIPKRK